MAKNTFKTVVAVGLGAAAVWIGYKVFKAMQAKKPIDTAIPTTPVVKIPKVQIDKDGNIVYTDKGLSLTVPDWLNPFSLFHHTKEGQDAATSQQAINEIAVSVNPDQASSLYDKLYAGKLELGPKLF